MPQIQWNNYGERYFEAGIDRGVLYVTGKDGVAWNGLISVEEKASGGESTPYYLEGVKYAERSAREEFEASIEAYTYPEEFLECDGSEFIAQGLYATQQERKPFGFSYRTRIGNDHDGIEHGYKIHLVYNALAKPSDRSYGSLGDSMDPTTFSWDITTKPVAIPGISFGAHLVINSTTAWPWAIKAVEDVLYGTEDTPAYLPDPQEVLDLFVENAFLKIVDNGDGTWTATTPDDDLTGVLTMTDETTFQINWPSAVMIDEDSYTISSL